MSLISIHTGHECILLAQAETTLEVFLDVAAGPLDVPFIRDSARVFFEALDFLHDTVRMVHGDIKPAQLLFKTRNPDGTPLATSLASKRPTFLSTTFGSNSYRLTL